MADTLRTLVGLKVDTTNIPIQKYSVNHNIEWKEVKASATLSNDYTTLIKRMTEASFETYDIYRLLMTALSGGLYKKTDVEAYLGEFADAPDGDIFYTKTGVSKNEYEDGLVYIDTINCPLNDVVSVSFKVRGVEMKTETTNLETFIITHDSLYMIDGISFNEEETIYGVKDLTISTNFEFYDYYKTKIDPDMSAITGIKPRAKCSAVVDAIGVLDDLTGNDTIVLHFKRCIKNGVGTESGGTITLNNCNITYDSQDANLGEIATVGFDIIIGSLTFALTGAGA